MYKRQELRGAVRAIEGTMGAEPWLDWNEAWANVQKIVKTLPDDVEGWTPGAKGAAQKKTFRDCFTAVDTEAAPVIAKHYRDDPMGTGQRFPGQNMPADLTTRELYTCLLYTSRCV